MKVIEEHISEEQRLKKTIVTMTKRKKPKPQKHPTLLTKDCQHKNGHLVPYNRDHYFYTLFIPNKTLQQLNSNLSFLLLVPGNLEMLDISSRFKQTLFALLYLTYFMQYISKFIMRI